MTTTTGIPIVCILTGTERTERGDSFGRAFAEVTQVEELPDAYAFTVPGRASYLTRLVGLIAAERKCCRFLDFALTFEPDDGPVRLEIGGSTDAKEFVRDHMLPKAPGAGVV